MLIATRYVVKTRPNFTPLKYITLIYKLTSWSKLSHIQITYQFVISFPVPTMKYYMYEEEATQRAKSLVKRGLSLRKASEETGVPFNTIRDHLRYDMENKSEIVRGRNRELSDSEESDLTNYATYSI